jgi:hypothetical protein
MPHSNRVPAVECCCWHHATNVYLPPWGISLAADATLRAACCRTFHLLLRPHFSRMPAIGHLTCCWCPTVQGACCAAPQLLLMPHHGCMLRGVSLAADASLQQGACHRVSYLLLMPTQHRLPWGIPLLMGCLPWGFSWLLIPYSPVPTTMGCLISY